MKRNTIFAGALVALLALTFTASAFAATINGGGQVSRAKYPNGVCTPDSASFILEGNSGSAPTCNDTTAAIYVGDHAANFAPLAWTSTSVPLFVVSVSGVPTGVAVDTIRAFIDYAQSKNGPWLTAGQAVPTGWDITCLQVAPTAASDTTGAGATKALYAAGSTAVSPLSTLPVYKGILALTGATAGTSNTSPIGWDWMRLRLTGDKTTGTLSSLFGARVWVTFPVNVADEVGPSKP